MGGRQSYATFETCTAVADGARASEIAATTSPFRIEVRFVRGLTPGQKAVFAEAAERGTRVSVGDLETAIVRDFSDTVIVDDVRIDAEGVPVDGTGQVPDIPGQAGPTPVGEPPAPVPVADDGGTGSAGSRWRESVSDHGLTSPSVDGSGNPLSRLTVASLQDLRHTVDLDAAEPYVLPNLFSAARSGRVLAADPRRLVLPTLPSRVPAEAP
ncbi:hypothetical protein ACF1BN_20720 [Streptomyces sp. NPDC014861]|uniref:hypothetical protein n=1 Tax=Streptomyces sp. NPDC014861 TaxID=3364923 RepID=UPI0036F8F6FB